jgi:hypothetical protein
MDDQRGTGQTAVVIPRAYQVRLTVRKCPIFSQCLFVSLDGTDGRSEERKVGSLSADG